LVTAYTVQRPDGKWSVMLVNKDRDHDHAVKVSFADSANNQKRSFSGTVDRVVFGAAEYEWHADPLSNTGNAGQSGQRNRTPKGHASPDGPPSHATITSDGPDTLYKLPKASIVVLRGNLQ
jgi:hypothetical protein